jgi:hypothetical protein
MNAQEIFDTAVKHMADQGQPGGRLNEYNDFVCEYRGNGNSRCAVGIFIPDGTYEANMEGNDVLRLLEDYGDALPSWMSYHINLLRDLQSAHDSMSNWYSPQLMRRALLEVADRHDLKSDVIYEVEFPAIVKKTTEEV